MSSIFINLLFLTLWEQILGRSTYQCHNVDQCALQSISDTTTRCDSNVECFGYFSCWQATKIESTVTASIYCYGAYSCYQSTLIQHTGSSYQTIFCYGLFACAQVESIYNANGSLHCLAELSCAESTVVIDAHDAYCLGTRSCYRADLTVAGAMHLVGHLAAQDAILRAGDTSVDFHFEGDYAGNGAEVI